MLTGSSHTTNSRNSMPSPSSLHHSSTHPASSRLRTTPQQHSHQQSNSHTNHNHHPALPHSHSHPSFPNTLPIPFAKVNGKTALKGIRKEDEIVVLEQKKYQLTLGMLLLSPFISALRNVFPQPKKWV